MRILMLDKNWLIDRRISLFVRSLQNMGHDLRCLYVQPPAERWERTQIDCEAIAFPYEDKGLEATGSGIFARPAHVREVHHPGSADPRYQLGQQHEVAELLSEKYKDDGLMNFLQMAIQAPDVLREQLRSSNVMLPIRAPVSLILALLAAPRGLIKPRANSNEIQLLNLKSAGGQPFDHWDKQVVQYGLTQWQPDLICANDYLCLRSALQIKKMLGVPVIYDAHELYSYQPTVAHMLAKKMFAEEMAMVKHIDGMITVNEQHLRIVKRDSKYKGISATCPNATSQPDGFDIRKRYNYIRSRASIPENHKIMIFQGGINKYRRIDFLLKGMAASRVRDVHMVFLTFGAEVESFRDLADSLGIGARVHFLPMVPWDEVVFWAASADVGVMPYQATDQNTAISSPNKMYEFIVSGTPMIGSSDLVNVRDIVGGNGFGITQPLRSISDYSQIIERIFDSDAGGPNRFRQALINKHEQFDWAHQSLNALELYEQIIPIATKKALRNKRRREDALERFATA